jgi:hypothetical protein
MYTLFKQSRPFSRRVRGILVAAAARALLVNANPNGILYQKYEENIKCICQSSEKTTAESAAINDQSNTQVQNNVNTLLFVPGGRTQFGNFLTNTALMAYLEERKTNPNINAFIDGRTNFNGKFEGQPGGIRGPLRIRNRF